jgi:carboxymethylenebutenolidase
VIFFMDGLAIRPMLWEMCQRVADGGYLVLLPDLFYRSGLHPQMVPAQVFSPISPKSKRLGSKVL